MATVSFTHTQAPRFTGQKCAPARFVNPKLLLFVTKGGLAWPIIPAKSRNQFCAPALAVPLDQARDNSTVSWSRNTRHSRNIPSITCGDCCDCCGFLGDGGLFDPSRSDDPSTFACLYDIVRRNTTRTRAWNGSASAKRRSPRRTKKRKPRRASSPGFFSVALTPPHARGMGRWRHGVKWVR